MTKSGAPSRFFYYAEGKRVPLAEERRYRVLTEVALERLVVEEPDRRRVRERARSLPGGLLLVDLDQIPKPIADALASDASLSTVFRHGRELIHVLPEIAVASSDPSALAAARRLLEGAQAEVQGKRDDEFVARLPAASGAEILELAGRVFDQAHPEMAQPRFLRVLPRPKPAR